MVDSSGHSFIQRLQELPLSVSNALILLSPMSLPRKSVRTSEPGEKKQDAQTFKNDSIFQYVKIGQAGQNTYRSRASAVSENVELVGTLKILGRVESETTTPICTGRCRKLCIKIRVLAESQTFLLVLKPAEVPQNLLKAWIVTKNLWHRIRGWERYR